MQNTQSWEVAKILFQADYEILSTAVFILFRHAEMRVLEYGIH